MSEDRFANWFKHNNRIDYDFFGNKNTTKNHQKFVDICTLSQNVLKSVLIEWLKQYYTDVISEDGFIYARGQQNVLLTAHMDTVHNETVKDFYEYTEKARTIISSPQGIGGDDRCGIYMIQCIVEIGLRPYILFCEDEEIGGIGSDKFCKTNYIKELESMMFLVECDRANANDLVFYEDENEEFHAWCEQTTGYKTSVGSFSDISNLCPACGVSGVNISCGYYNAHTTSEYVVVEEMDQSILAVIALISCGVDEGTRWEYTEYDYDFSTTDFYGSRTYEFLLADGTLKYEYADDLYQAIGYLLTDNPNLRWNDVMEYYEN